MKFYWLTGDCNWQEYGGTWVSDKFNNGDFDYCLFRDIRNVESCNCNTEYKYSVTLGVVSIDEASKTNALEQTIACCGWEEEEIEIDEQMKLEALISYGCYAHIQEFTGNNYQKLFKECSKEAKLTTGLFGFYIDRHQNGFGATGWDALKGIKIPQVEKAQ